MASKDSNRAGLFPALLKYWRGLRGMSQLDLATTSDVSSRHLSFLETGRSQPSEEMLLRLAENLQVPLREQNALLEAAGFPPRFSEPGMEEFDGPIAAALESMLAKHEPYPMVVMNQYYDVRRTNRAAEMLFLRFVSNPGALATPLNLIQMVFDPELARPYIVDWNQSAQLLLARLHRESLAARHDKGLNELIESLFQFPGVEKSWRQPNFAAPSAPVFTLRLARDDLECAFLTTVTQFSAPQNVTLDELAIESYFPLDQATTKLCERLAETG